MESSTTVAPFVDPPHLYPNYPNPNNSTIHDFNKWFAPTLTQEMLEEKTKAEIAHLIAETAVLETKAEYQAMELRNLKSSPAEARTYTFNAPIMNETVSRCIDALDAWSRRHPKKDLTVVFNSPGGYVFEGFALFDFLQHLKRRKHKIITKALGGALSMAAILLQAGDHRVMSPNSFLMLHEQNAGFEGSLSELTDSVKAATKFQEKAMNILVEKSALSKAQVKNLWNRRDYWLDADEALKKGLVDEIGY